MHFYQSATRYEEAHFNHEVERVSECTMIFERYISRNADEQVDLPASIRSTIVKQLFRGHQTLFSVAAEWAINHLCANYWALFTSEVNANASVKNDITMGSAILTIAEASAAGSRPLADKFSPLSQKSAPLAMTSSDNSLNSFSIAGGPVDDLGRRWSTLAAKLPYEIDTRAAAYKDDSEQIGAVSEFAALAAKKFPVRLEMHSGGAFSASNYLPDSCSFVTPQHMMVDAPQLLHHQSTHKIVPVSASQTSRFSRLSSESKNGTACPEQQSAPAVKRDSRNRALTSVSAPRASGTETNLATGTLAVHSKSSGSLLSPRAFLQQSSISAMTTSNFNAALHRLERKAAPSSAKEVLEHSNCCSVFKEFLSQEGLAQTLLFFIEVEEFRRIPNIDFQTARARKICNKYIHDLAVMPIPVSNSIRQEVIAQLADSAVLPTLFQQASEEVLRYIEIYQFPRFQRSPEFVEVVSILTKELQTSRHSPAMKRNSSLVIRGISESDTRSLKQILLFQLPTRYFKDFCVRTKCGENILFWLDVENYVHLPGSDYMRRVACKIYKKYVADDAKMQVNIGFDAKQEVFSGLTSGNRHLFKNVSM